MENPFLLIFEKLDKIETSISVLTHTGQQEPPEADLMNISQAANFLNLAKASIYNKASKKEIPYCKQGKKLYFSKSDLLEWIKAGKRLTHEQLKEEVHSILAQQKKPGAQVERVKKFIATKDIDHLTTEEASKEAGQIHFAANKESLKFNSDL